MADLQIDWGVKKKKKPTGLEIDWGVSETPQPTQQPTLELEEAAPAVTPTVETGYGDGSPKSWEDFTAGEAMWYASKLGLWDTVRGVGQILNIHEEEMAKDQGILNELMQHPEYGGRVTAAYFGGMIADPVGWFIPATKARTVAKMAKHGLMWGAGAGAAGYVDPEMKSLVGEGPLRRGEQAVMGAAGGAVISPFMGKMMQLGKKGYAPVGEKIWQSISKNPEVGMGLAGGLMGYNYGEDTTTSQDFHNALMGVAAGIGGGAGLRRLNRGAFGLQAGDVGRFFIPSYGQSDKYLQMKGMDQTTARRAMDKFEIIAAAIWKQPDDKRELIWRVLAGEADLEDPFGKMAQNQGYTLKEVGLGKSGVRKPDGTPILDPNPRAVKIDSVTGERRPVPLDQVPAAFTNRNKKIIYFDSLVARQKFDVKAWRTPKEYDGVFVKALPDELFPDYRSWENFVKTHEVMHTIHPRLKKGETFTEGKAAYEDRINQLAIRQLQDQPIHIPLQKLADEARDLIDKHGKELVDLGVINPETFEKNRLTYMHRMFKNPDYHNEQSKLAFIHGSDHMRSVGDELRLRGKAETLNPDEWEINRTFVLDEKNNIDVIGIRQKDGNLLTHLDTPQVDKNGKTFTFMDRLRRGEIHSGNIKEITVRKDWTPEERLQMNEVTDAAVALQKTGQLMSNDIGAHRFFKAVADEYAVTPKKIMTKEGMMHDVELPPDYSKVAVPDNRAKYGDLAGKYIPKNIHHDIVAMDEWRSGAKFKKPWMRGYRSLNSWWKLTKTAYNAPTHLGNFSSNVAMYDFNGGSRKALGQAFDDLLFPSKLGESPRLKEARLHGVFGGNYIGNDVLRKNKELFRAYGNSFHSDSKTIDKMFEFTPETILKIGKKARNLTLDQAQKLYTWEDNVFRLGLYYTKLAEGVDPTTATRIAREGFVDYEKSAPALEMLRHSVIPFAAYGYGIAPRIAEAMAKRPWKFAKWAAIIAAVNAVGEELTNDPDKVSRERALMSKGQDRTILDLPLFPSTMLKVAPQLSSTQDSRYVNIARNLPGQFSQYTHQGFNVPFLPDVMQPTFGAAGGLAFPLMGIGTFTGEKIPQMSDRFKEVGRQFMPNLPIPGIGTYAGTKMERGMVPGGYQSLTRENHTLVTSILQNLGIRLESVDASKQSGHQYYRLKEKQDNARKKLRTLERDFGERLYEGKEKVYQKKLQKLYDELQGIDALMMKIGI